MRFFLFFCRRYVAPSPPRVGPPLSVVPTTRRPAALVLSCCTQLQRTPPARLGARPSRCIASTSTTRAPALCEKCSNLRRSFFAFPCFIFASIFLPSVVLSRSLHRARVPSLRLCPLRVPAALEFVPPWRYLPAPRALVSLRSGLQPSRPPEFPRRVPAAAPPSHVLEPPFLACTLRNLGAFLCTALARCVILTVYQVAPRVSALN